MILLVSLPKYSLKQIYNYLSLQILLQGAVLVARPGQSAGKRKYNFKLIRISSSVMGDFGVVKNLKR